MSRSISPVTPEAAPSRRRYVDLARALAILIMIEAHAVDSWTRPLDRSSIAFRNAQILGGFAAPLFLWLAGVAVVFSAEAALRRHGRRASAVETVCRRGLEIFILAFVFRIQAFLLTPGGDSLMIFRVDILNIMGPAIVLAALVWGFTATAPSRAISYAAIAAAIAMLTPIVRATPLLDRLPVLVQWYLRPAGQQTTFVMFPWAGFVFAGAAAGVVLAAVDARRERRAQAVLASAGAAIVGLGFYAATLPSIYRESSFWTSSPAYFAIRVGIVMTVVAALYSLDQITQISHESTKTRNQNSPVRAFVRWWPIPLQQFGRSSLFIYWIHVELVYGYATWALHGRLPLWGALVACAVFAWLMYLAAVAKDRVRQWSSETGVDRLLRRGLSPGKEAT
jgi:uncharacterized membrane protein